MGRREDTPAARLRRIFIPLVIVGLAVGVLTSIIFSKRRPAPPAAIVATGPEDTATTSSQVEPPPETPASPPPSPDEPSETTGPSTAPPGEAVFLEGLHPRLVPEGPAPASLGALDDPDAFRMALHLDRVGAGISAIPFADVWQTARTRRAAAAWRAARASDRTDATPPDESLRYILLTSLPLHWIDPDTGDTRSATIPLLAAHSIEIEGAQVGLLPATTWREVGPGTFEALVVNADDEPVVRITRRWELGDSWNIVLRQRIENLAGRLLSIRWQQYGPPSLVADRARYMDRRRFRFGYELPIAQDPDGLADIDPGVDLALELSSVIKQDEADLWRHEVGGPTLAWFASTNRYFAMTIHPLLPDVIRGDRTLARTVERIARTVHEDEAQGAWILTELYAPEHVVEPGGTLVLDLGVYAGPLDRHVLDGEQPFDALNMRGMILYQMSAMCAFCTFQWLAILLLNILSFLQAYVVFDWSLSIIGLVIIVRTLLHPITKRSQVNMQRFGRVMSAMKPEIDRLKQTYPDDPKRMQQEQMRMMKEKGVNPLHMLGCLPMFLQMPIWVALYAMLYFAFDLRQEPAFFGFFQVLGGWSFLGDLSAADHLVEFDEPRRILFLNVTGFNLLPFLMGAIFFFQQKYMSPPPSAAMTKEQAQQQKIMRFMMVVMFPIMLYSAPSGLTLYILTSSTVGILESRHIRHRVDAMDLDAPSGKDPPGKKPGGSRDPRARAYTKALERAKEKARRHRGGPRKRFKKRQ